MNKNLTILGSRSQFIKAIVVALSRFVETMPMFWPIHPRTRTLFANQIKLNNLSKRVVIIEPIGYLEMVQLEKYAALIAIDFCGVQKEAVFYKIPDITLRDETDWVESVDAGWNKLVSPINADTLLHVLKSSIGSVDQDVILYALGNISDLIIKRLSSGLL